MKHWIVNISPSAEKDLRRVNKRGLVTKQELKLILRWIDEMEEFGPNFIQSAMHWHDHALEGKWFGFRSSAFSSSGRILYKIQKHQIVVSVVRITAIHDYR